MTAEEIYVPTNERFRSILYTISDFIGWHDRGELIISPDFQRRGVWTTKAKSYLIDSIVRGMPIPQLFIRQIVHPSARRTVREVVDGQQRLKAIIGFIGGEFTVLPVHNPGIARTRYDDLPESIQGTILSYPLSVNVLIGNSDQDVLEVFSRINSYSITLNRQEKLNAEFSGAFKQSMHQLAWRHYAYWRDNKILSATEIARMGEVDLTADLVSTMMTELRHGSAHIRDHYKKYDDEFPLNEVVGKQFNHVLSLIETMVGIPIAETEFRRRPLFYSLFTATHDVVFGFGNSTSCPAMRLDKEGITGLNIIMQNLSDRVKERETEGRVGEFVRANQGGTNTLATRKLRHEFLKTLISSAFVPHK